MDVLVEIFNGSTFTIIAVLKPDDPANLIKVGDQAAIYQFRVASGTACIGLRQVKIQSFAPQKEGLVHTGETG